MKKKLEQSSKGFTVIELIIVIAIVALIGSIAIPLVGNMILRSNFDTVFEQTMGSIRKAQGYGMDGKNNETWGVCKSGDNIRLFSETCASPTYSEDYPIPGNVNVTGLNETTFNLRGEPSSTMEVTISTNLESGTITVGPSGGISSSIAGPLPEPDPDTDNDGILDDGDDSGDPNDNPCTGGETVDCDDNCVNDPNADQADEDSDGIGDVCDDPQVDTDSDGIYDDGDFSGTPGDNPCTGGETVDCDDNCVNDPNTDQADDDSDGIGNVCDSSFPPDWWDEDWSNRVKMYFQNGTRAEAFSNFPVLVVLDSSLVNYGTAKPDGSDLRFIDADGVAELDYHIEEWNTSGNSYIWVKVPQVDASTNADYMHMYYGNGSAPDVQDAGGTYDSSYLGVWHLNETIGGNNAFKDSTNNNHHATNQGTPGYGISGVAGNAIDFQGNPNCLYTANTSSLNTSNEITLEVWIKADSYSGYPTFVSRGTNYWGLYAYSPWNTVSFWVNNYNQNYSDEYLSDTTSWHYLVGTYDRFAGNNNLKIYVDGNLTTYVLDTYAGLINTGSEELTIGCENRTAYFFNGKVDEVRLGNSARSGNWINAQYASMSNTFIVYQIDDP